MGILISRVLLFINYILRDHSEDGRFFFFKKNNWVGQLYLHRAGVENPERDAETEERDKFFFFFLSF